MHTIPVCRSSVMCVITNLFRIRLRRIKDPDDVAPNGAILKNRIGALMEEIAMDIKKCGSDCELYLKTSLIGT